MKNEKKIPHIAVTMGDPSGIGPEIAVKVLAKGIYPIKIYGNEKLLLRTAKSIGLVINKKDIVNTFDLTNGQINEIIFGNPSKLTGETAYSAIERAVKDCLSGESSGIVTGPISKVGLNLAGHKWPGHTELISHLADPANPPKVRMVLLSENFFIVLNSIHVSLKDAIFQLNEEILLDTLQITDDWCKKHNTFDIKYWVSGLNPHAGESGLLGDEETKIINPFIKTALSKGFNISGPWPADTLYMKIRRINDVFFPKNVIISLYHDQALIPFKLDGLENGINLTAGLPFLRTSVDHGTAYDIAGKGTASEIPLETAISKTQILASKIK